MLIGSSFFQYRILSRTSPLSLLMVVLLGLSAGCATVPPASDIDATAEFLRVNDPMEPMNRSINGFNQVVDKVLIKPVAKVYRFIIPRVLRRIVTNILRNLDEPLTLVNDVLQGEGRRAGQTLGRFVTNSTIGVAGAFDVAVEFGLERHSEDFGQTLGAWGFEEGPYLVLPLLGPSTIRDGVGLGVDFFMHPTNIAIDQANVKGLSLIRFGVAAIDSRERNIETLDELKASSIDFYATMRSAYRQNRRKEVRNGAPLEDEDEFDVFDSFDALDAE